MKNDSIKKHNCLSRLYDLTFKAQFAVNSKLTVYLILKKLIFLLVHCNILFAYSLGHNVDI